MVEFLSENWFNIAVILAGMIAWFNRKEKGDADQSNEIHYIKKELGEVQVTLREINGSLTNITEKLIGNNDRMIRLESELAFRLSAVEKRTDSVESSLKNNMDRMLENQSRMVTSLSAIAACLDILSSRSKQ